MSTIEQIPVSATASTPSATDTQGFDNGSGTGEPSPETARLLRLMKAADDGYNGRDFKYFLEERHHHDVLVHQIGSPDTVGLPPHDADMKFWIEAFPDMKVHNNPYDVQFGQGEWTVALGKLSGTFTGPLTLPNGVTVPPTGKSFTTFFTTIARWQNDQMIEEYVLFDPNQITAQVS